MALVDELVSKLGPTGAVSRLRELWMPEIALPLVEKEIAEKGESKALLRTKAELLFEAEKPDEALEVFAKAGGLGDAADVDLALVAGHAELLLEKGSDATKASALLDGAVKAMADLNLRNVPDGFVNAARVRVLKSDLEKAEDHVESALVKGETAAALLAMGAVQLGWYFKELNKRVKEAQGGAPAALAAALSAQKTQEKDAAMERLKAAAENFRKAGAKGSGGPHVAALWRQALAEEELALYGDLAPLPAKAVRSVKAGENQAATESAMEDEIKAIAKAAFLPPTASVEEVLKALEEEYSSLIKAGRSDAAAFVQELHGFKAAQAAAAAEAKAAGAGGGAAKESPAGQALQRAAEALERAVGANGERAELRTRLARVLLLQGSAKEAAEQARAGVAAARAGRADEARFYLGIACAAAGPLDAEAAGHLEAGRALVRAAAAAAARAKGQPRGEIRGLLCADLARPTNADLPRGALALARHLAAAGRHGDALAVLEELAGYVPDALPLCRPRQPTHAALERAFYEAKLLSVECLRALGRRVAAARALLEVVPKLFELALGYNARMGVPFPLVDLLDAASRSLAEGLPSYAHGQTLRGNAALLLWEHEKEGARLAQAEEAYRRGIQLEGAPVEAVADGARPAAAPAAAAAAGPSSAAKPAGAAAGAKGAAAGAKGAAAGAKGAAPAAKPAAAPAKPAAAAAKPAPAAAAKGGAAAAAKGGASPPPKPAVAAGAKAGAGPASGAKGAVAAKPAAPAAAAKGAPAAAKPAAAPAGKAAAPPAKPAAAAAPAKAAGGPAPTAPAAAAAGGGEAKFVPGGAEKNPKSVEPRLGLAKALKEKGGEDAALEGVYREIIALDPANHDAVFGLGGLLEAAGRIKESVAVYAAFPCDHEKPTFDDAALHGEIVKMLFKGKLEGDPQMAVSLTLVGRVLGLPAIEKDVEKLEAKGQYETLKAVYCGVNRRAPDDADMLRFFQSKFWA